MNDYSYHTVSSIINAFQKSANFPFNELLQDRERYLYEGEGGYTTESPAVSLPMQLFETHLEVLCGVFEQDTVSWMHSSSSNREERETSGHY